MSIINQGVFIGRFCFDMELKQSKGGKTYLRNTVAVDGYKKDSPSTFVPVIFWDERAKFVDKYFSKGDPVGISYTLRNGTQTVYDGGEPVLNKDGEEIEQERLEVVVTDVQFMPANTPKGGGQKQATGGNVQPKSTEAPSIDLNDFEDIGDDEDLPF